MRIGKIGGELRDFELPVIRLLFGTFKLFIIL